VWKIHDQAIAAVAHRHTITSCTFRFTFVAHLGAARQHFGATDATLVTLATSNHAVPQDTLAPGDETVNKEGVA
jgi:hypothetical protein